MTYHDSYQNVKLYQTVNICTKIISMWMLTKNTHLRAWHAWPQSNKNILNTPMAMFREKPYC